MFPFRYNRRNPTKHQPPAVKKTGLVAVRESHSGRKHLVFALERAELTDTARPRQPGMRIDDACFACGQVLGLLVPVGSTPVTRLPPPAYQPAHLTGTLPPHECREGDLILGQASRLDAFSGYPSRT